MTENCPSRLKLDMACKTFNNKCASSRTLLPDASLLLHSCIMLQAISLSSVCFCVYLLSAPSGQSHLHLGCISDRKCLYCPLVHIQEYTYNLTEPRARSDHLSGRQQAEEAHQGLTREDQRAHYHSSPLPLTPSPSLSLPFTSNKRPASLSLCLLGSDNRTCPEPKEMNYLPHSLLYS